MHQPALTCPTFSPRSFVASAIHCEHLQDHLTSYPPFPSSVQTDHLQLVSLGPVSYMLDITFK